MLTVRELASGLVAVLALGALAGCGSDEEEPGPGEPTASAASATPSAYVEVPAGVELTAPGTELMLGEQAVVGWPLRQDRVAALGVTVTRIERTSFQESFTGWDIDDVTAARTPYFVRLEVASVSDQDLGGVLVDNALWADDGTTLEAPAYYAEEQQPLCSGGPLPAYFSDDDTAELCQVFFIAPGRTLESITFRPPDGLPPVTWTGEVSEVEKPVTEKGGTKPAPEQSAPEQSPAG